MQPNDVLCRSAIFPKFNKNGVFDDAQFLRLNSVMPEDKKYALSVVSEFGLKNERSIHAYGLRGSRVTNRRFEAEHGRKPDPDAEAVYYLGYYKFLAKSALSAPVLYYKVNIRWVLEHGALEHYQIEMGLLQKVSSSKRRADRIALRTAISNALIGPIVYARPAVLNRPAVLDEITLPSRPV